VTNPLFLVAGYKGDGASLSATATKEFWNSPGGASVPAFSVGERLDGTSGMPIARTTMDDHLAPYVFPDFLNKKTTSARRRRSFRTAGQQPPPRRRHRRWRG
jgi:hypothetical protein